MLLPKYVKRVRAKGRTYYYFDTGKVADGKKVYARLPDLRSREFGGSYAALLGHRNRGHSTELVRTPRLIDLYQRSPAYRGLSDASKKLYDIYLRKLEKLLPTAPVAEITRADMRKLFDGMAEKAGAANGFLSTSSALFAWAVAREYMPANPCDGIDQLPGGEHEPWPQHILDAALSADDGTVRLLTHLLLYTGQRLGDVLAMAWSDISGDHITVRQRKTGKVLVIRMHKDLRAELDKRKRAGVVICTDENGRAIRDQSARYRLQKFAADLGQKVVPHGLRKNAVIALLEADCSIAETAAISGQTLRMVEHYAKARNQQKLGDSAILRWEAKA
ncbi:integrase [Sphingomonas naasensis]|uniref:Tyr recombinase domain-containing protein n=1 Tax=Sphingomonas naasensis TaxID=1344951 RepID=A0A4S1WQS9_9SPHN|nr:tyrosine-type recombinase/integrase [Sphingomonas naasensis]NIJ18447.1 integrase [Sphingomonas naasensis]TGX45711.1 hypothetical protein E5A74_00575 [Sphingomonas naasensis]